MEEFKIQYMSDLHLEIFPGFRICQEHVASKYLVLAGDIGDPAKKEYETFIKDCMSKFEYVFIVLGNHEHYGRSIDQTVSIVEFLIRDLNNDKSHVVLLNKSSYDIIPGKLTIIGTTLWSYVDKYEVKSAIMDYRKIRGITNISDNNDLHNKDVAWINAELQLITDDRKIIVVTHHAPSRNKTSHPMYAGCPLNCAFATDLDHLLKPPVCAWIYGHTHYSNTRVLENGVVLTSNQRGYIDERQADDKFDPRTCLSISI